MKVRNKERKIVGMYHTDSTLIAKTQVSEPYWLHNTDESALDFLPVLDFIRINPNEEVKLCNGNGNGSEYLETYNVHNRFTPASEDIIKKRKIDVSANSLFGNDINLVINLTGLNLTLTFNNGRGNMYRPLDIPKLAHKHGGSLLIVTIIYLNFPKSVSDVYGVSNYLSVLKQKHSGKIDAHSRFLVEACGFLTDCLASEVITARAASDTIKLVTMVKVHERDIKTITADGGFLVRSGYGGDILVEAVCPSQAKLHPDLTVQKVDNRILEAMRGNGVCCFIVDNHDAIGDRYFNYAGTVMKVHKYKDLSKIDGLYVMGMDAGKKASVADHIPLDKIDESKYIFKSREEVNLGADIKMNISESLRSHALSHYPILHIITHDDAEVDTLIAQIEPERKIMEWNMARGLVRFDTKQPLMAWCDLAAALDNLLDQELTRHFIVIRDAHMGLRDQPLAVARLKALTTKILESVDMEVTIILVSSEKCVPRELEKFITLFEVPLPDEAAIRAIITQYADAYGVTVDEYGLKKLCLAFQGLSRYEIGQLINRGYQKDGMIGAKDIDLVQTEKSQIIQKSGLLEMVKLREKMEDIGGLEKLKPWLVQKSKIFADWPAARDFGVESPKGLMIVGMPGCGKSLTAKATASLFGLPLLKMDMGSLMGKYVGESEGNMRRAIAVAEAVSPCVLWVDEVEKAFTGIGSGIAGSEVATRLFGYFLTWMQEKTAQVFVVATANDISALPPELLRKGRFDEIFYVDFPNEAERNAIFRVHLEKRQKMNAYIDLSKLAQATDKYSGADIESIVKEGIELAFLADRAELNTQRLLQVVEATHPLGMVMKDKVKQYKDRFAEMKIKSAS